MGEKELKCYEEKRKRGNGVNGKRQFAMKISQETHHLDLGKELKEGKRTCCFLAKKCSGIQDTQA